VGNIGRYCLLFLDVIKPKTNRRVNSWLEKNNSLIYSEALHNYGYDRWDALQYATEEDIREMTNDADVNMKKMHRDIFIHKWKKRLGDKCGKSKDNNSENDVSTDSEDEACAPIAECAGSAKSARSDAGARDALAAGIRHKHAAQPRCGHVQLPHTMYVYGRAVRGQGQHALLR
jgi:hypothetical protein